MMSNLLYVYKSSRIIKFEPAFREGYCPEKFKATFREAKESKIVELQLEMDRLERKLEQVRAMSESECIDAPDPFR